MTELPLARLLGSRDPQQIAADISPAGLAEMATYADGWKRLKKPGHRIQLAIPELFADLVRLSYETPASDEDYPFVLSDVIKHRAQTNNPFKEKELYYLLYAMASTKKDSSSFNEPLGDIRPDNIFLSQN